MFILQDVPQAADLLPPAVRGGNVPAEFGEVDGARVPEGDVGVDVHARGLDQLGHRLATLAGVADLDQHLVVKQALQTLCKEKALTETFPHSSVDKCTFDLVSDHDDLAAVVRLRVFVGAVLDAPRAGGDDAWVRPDVHGGRPHDIFDLH